MSLGVAQKKRLEAFSKMGLGPDGKAVRQPKKDDDILSNMPKRIDKAAMAMERERKFREQQEMSDDEEDRVENKKPKIGGLQRLGPVMPREDFEEPPVPRPPPQPRSGGVMQLRVSVDTAERVRSGTSSETPAAPPVDPVEAERQRLLEQAQQEKRERERRALREREKLQRKREEEEEATRKRRKKKKKKRRRDSSDESEDDEEEDEPEEKHEKPQSRVQHGGLSSRFMTVECPKGKMSRANEGFTDADLERRFGARSTSSSGLMSEEQVKNMLELQKRRDKTQREESASARVKRELEEWNSVKQMRRTVERLKGPEEEHLVYSSERWMGNKY